jgi:hypothetical protein
MGLQAKGGDVAGLLDTTSLATPQCGVVHAPPNTGTNTTTKVPSPAQLDSTNLSAHDACLFVFLFSRRCLAA